PHRIVAPALSACLAMRPLPHSVCVDTRALPRHTAGARHLRAGESGYRSWPWRYRGILPSCPATRQGASALVCAALASPRQDYREEFQQSPPCQASPRPPSLSLPSLRWLELELLGKRRQVVTAGARDQHGILDPYPADAKVIQAGLNRNHVPCLQGVIDATDTRRFMNLQAHTMAGTMEKSLHPFIDDAGMISYMLEEILNGGVDGFAGCTLLDHLEA